MYDLSDFLEPVDLTDLNEEFAFTDGQLAKNIRSLDGEISASDTTDIVLVGVQEARGGSDPYGYTGAADQIRKHLYRLHYWHEDVEIADVGNIRSGATLNDSYAAIKTVISELLRAGKTVILLGGSHDITLAQYQAHMELEQVLDATCIDSMIDLRSESSMRSENFLLELLTGEPNLVRHYNHIGFQSYFVHPRMLETMDRLHFDCFRVGKVREDIEQMEPVIRKTHLLSFDINAIRHSDSPASVESPNGFSGEEACTLARFAGMSTHLSTFGIYGYNTDLDRQEMTAKQIAQMIWYFIDGRQIMKGEGSLKDKENFYEYHTAFGDIDTVFLQNKKTKRWWMQIPDKRFIPCSYADYAQASANQIPERWIRAQEIS